VELEGNLATNLGIGIRSVEDGSSDVGAVRAARSMRSRSEIAENTRCLTTRTEGESIRTGDKQRAAEDGGGLGVRASEGVGGDSLACKIGRDRGSDIDLVLGNNGGGGHVGKVG
jgi:hypothetical protein